MKYKSGDKVIINKENHSGAWSKSMERFKGTVMTINEDYAFAPFYFTKEGYFIGDDDIEGLT